MKVTDAMVKAFAKTHGHPVVTGSPSLVRAALENALAAAEAEPLSFVQLGRERLRVDAIDGYEVSSTGTRTHVWMRGQDEPYAFDDNYGAALDQIFRPETLNATEENDDG